MCREGQDAPRVAAAKLARLLLEVRIRVRVRGVRVLGHVRRRLLHVVRRVRARALPRRGRRERIAAGVRAWRERRRALVRWAGTLGRATEAIVVAAEARVAQAGGEVVRRRLLERVVRAPRRGLLERAAVRGLATEVRVWGARVRVPAWSNHLVRRPTAAAARREAVVRHALGRDVRRQRRRHAGRDRLWCSRCLRSVRDRRRVLVHLGEVRGRAEVRGGAVRLQRRARESAKVEVLFERSGGNRSK